MDERELRERLGDVLIDDVILIANLLIRLGRPEDRVLDALEVLFPEAGPIGPEIRKAGVRRGPTP